MRCPAISRSPKGDVHWWTWAGSATNRTLHASLPGLVDRRQRVGDHAVRLFSDMSFSAVKKALTGTLTEKPPEVNDSAVEGLKFASALPDSLARATVAERLADLWGMREVLREPRSYIHDAD
jgi:ATP-dependent helicase Lhr and Lhr-like helicase